MENNTASEGFFKQIFSKKKLSHLFISNLIGNFIGFAVGFFTSTMFSHYEYAKRSFGNLFGLVQRKKILVDDTPGWLHWIISVLLGFIAMEIFHFIVENKMHLVLWKKLKGKGKS